MKNVDGKTVMYCEVFVTGEDQSSYKLRPGFTKDSLDAPSAICAGSTEGDARTVLKSTFFALASAVLRPGHSHA